MQDYLVFWISGVKRVVYIDIYYLWIGSHSKSAPYGGKVTFIEILVQL